MQISFNYFFISIVLILFGVFLYILKKIKLPPSPALFFPETAPLPKKRSAFFIADICFWGAFAFFLLALLNPRSLELETVVSKIDSLRPREGIAIYLVLDRSGSMAQQFSGKQSKLDLMKQMTREFIKDRPNDLIGIVAFSRGAQVVSPLSLDHQLILQRLEKMQVTQSADQDGTAIGYAIFKTANLVAAVRESKKENASFDIKSTVMVLVTDGLQDPNPLDNSKRWRTMDPVQAAEYAAELKIRLYIVNVEPKIASEEFASHRRLMQKAAESTGGAFYTVDRTHTLASIYDEIDRLEKSPLPEQTSEQLVQHETFYFPVFLLLGLALLMLHIVFESTWFLRVP